MSLPRHHPKLISVGAVVIVALVIANSTPLAERPQDANRADAESVDGRRSVSQAAEALLAGDAEKAAALYAEILASRPGNGSAMEGRIRALLLQDDWPRAVDEALGFVAAYPDDPHCTSALGEALLRAGRLNEAHARLEPLSALDSPPARGLMTLARLEAALGRGAEATALMDRAVALAPDDRGLLLRASEIAADRPEAIRRLERFLELSEGFDPDRVLAAGETLQMLRALGDRRVWISGKRPNTMEVPLKRVVDATRRRLGYAVQVGLGPQGKPVRLLLDTGASGLHVVERLAKKHGFEPLSRTTMFGGGGDEQRHDTSRGLFSSFTLGELEFTNALASASPVELEPNGLYQGLMGLGVFDGYRVTLDLKKQRLRLETPVSGFEGAKYWVLNGQLLVRAGATEGGEGMFLFDTGAGVTLLHTGFVEQVPSASLSGISDVRAFGGQIPGAQVARGLQIAFQGLVSRETEYRAVDLSLRSRLGGVEVSGFLGLDLLQGSRIVFDTSSRRLTVDRPGKR